MEKELLSWREILPDINERLLDNLTISKFTTPSPIQLATIPPMTSNKDVNVKAVTGSGKTLAFLVPIIHILGKRQDRWKRKQIGALILTPTRELAQQIHQVFVSISDGLKLKSRVLIGGTSIDEDFRAFDADGGNVVIATPGRLEAMLESNDSFVGCLRYLEVLVLDEADRLLDMGFSESISIILKHIPKQRRTGLFSATKSEKVSDLLKAGLRNPVDVMLGDFDDTNQMELEIPHTLCNYYKMCDLAGKMDFLVGFLSCHKGCKILLFFATINCVEYFGEIIKRQLKDVVVHLLHRKLKRKRSQTLASFVNSKRGILVCSDLLARGIDIPHVDWVIQFEPPNKTNLFIHRIGRTARCGEAGSSLILLTPQQESFIDFLKLNQNIVLQHFDESVHKLDTCISTLLRDEALVDREIYLKGIRAYVSYVRFYQEHQLKHLFPFRDLNLCDLAKAFGLLHLPDMPEIKKLRDKRFEAVKMDYNTIPFRDADRERQRQIALKEVVKDKSTAPPVYVKSKRVKTQKNTFGSKRHKLTEDDIQELNEDSQILKRLKKGSIPKEELKNVFG